MRSFLVVNQACSRRQEEIERVRQFLIINRWKECSNLPKADLVILFTCGFAQSKVQEMLRQIVHLQAEMQTSAELIVGGCLPKTDPESLSIVFTGKTISPIDFSVLDRLEGITVKFNDLPPKDRQEPTNVPSPYFIVTKTITYFKEHGGLRTLQKIARNLLDKRKWYASKVLFLAAGCLRKCSYCAIRFATGSLRSKPLEEVMEEVLADLASGYRKLELYADSIGDYGLDLGTNLGELFDRLVALPQHTFSIGIYDLHPASFLKYFEHIMRLCQMGAIHCLYVPIQSGNERILRLMRRPCEVNLLKEKLLAVKKSKKVFMQTSIIVGFPTETEEEFEETVHFLKEVNFDHAYIHSYTDMPNTESSQLAGKIDLDIIQKRINQIRHAGIKHNIDATEQEWENLWQASRPNCP